MKQAIVYPTKKYGALKEPTPSMPRLNLILYPSNFKICFLSAFGRILRKWASNRSLDSSGGLWYTLSVKDAPKNFSGVVYLATPQPYGLPFLSVI